MGMYDIIETEQVKCFDNLLNHYKIGDKVPCKKFGYSKNLLIIPFEIDNISNRLDFYFIIIKNSKVANLKTIFQLNDKDFNHINEVITYRGTKVNIHNLNDLINYVEEAMILNVKDIINELRGINEDSYNNFIRKWMKEGVWHYEKIPIDI